MADTEHTKARSFKQTPVLMLVIMILSIVFCETAVMVLISALPPLSTLAEALLDSILLVVILSPILYFFMLQPLINNLNEHRRLEDELKEQSDMFEEQLQERTEELLTANVVLRNEIFERKGMENELKRLATTDSLTQTYNRLKFDELIAIEVARVERYGQSLSAIMLDIDKFKEVNDTYGHFVGDKVLKAVADRIKESKRGADHLIRWGGEEFIIIAPETDLERAKALTERIERAIEGVSFDKVEKLTASFGVGEFMKGEDVDTFLKRIDDALYKAKSSGRNRVEIAE